MFKPLIAGLLLIASGTAMAATSDQPDQPKEASIYFADMGSIDNFEAPDEYTLYVQDVRQRWYKASLLGPCMDLPFATAVRFDVRGTHTLDRFSSVIVNGRDCAFKSFVESDPPPGE